MDSSVSTYRQQLVHAPRYSMLRKWDKLIDVSYKAFLKADPSDMTPQRVVEFTDKLIATMQRDQAYNYTVTTNQHNGETFLYQDDIFSSLGIINKVTDKIINWGEYQTSTATDQTALRNEDNVIADSPEKHALTFKQELPDQKGSDSVMKRMHGNISEICALVMGNTTYGGEFDYMLRRQAEVLSILFSAMPVPQEEWKALTRAERIEHLNVVALATDYIMRSISIDELPDINNSTRDGRIVLQEPKTDCITISDDKTYTTLAHYRNGNVLLGLDEEQGFDATLEKDSCEDNIVHEMSHRLSDMLCSTERFKAENYLKTHNGHLEAIAKDIATKKGHGDKQLQYMLYRANVEETCARQQEARNISTRLITAGLGLTEDNVGTAKQICSLLLDAPKELQIFRPGLKKMLSQAGVELPTYEISRQDLLRL